MHADAWWYTAPKELMIYAAFLASMIYQVCDLDKKSRILLIRLFWSGLRGSNPPPPPWQGGALPNELNPRIWCLRSESNQRHGDFQSPALPTELQRHNSKGCCWRPGWGSNPRPLAWQASALTNWATKPFSKWDKISWWKVQGSNLWPSACKADALPTELTFRSVIYYSKGFFVCQA